MADPAPCPPVPPAEDWVRTPLAEITWIDDAPPTTGSLLMAGRTYSMRDDRDVRARLSDFVPLGVGANDDPLAFGQAIEAAKLLSTSVGEMSMWLASPAIGVLRGRDARWWGVVLREGDGSQAISTKESRVPHMKYGVGKRYEVTGSHDHLQAIVSGDHVTDLRRPI